MKKRILLLGILVAFATTYVCPQSLESQLKTIFGDFLVTHGKNDAQRSLGKALSTSGNMQYNMEIINAQSNRNITITQNQAIPNQGYQWANPENVSDFRVVPVNSYANLPPYDFGLLQNTFNYPLGRKNGISDLIDLGTTLKLLFTYNWVSDLNKDNKFSLDEFNNIKRTFKVGEPIGVVYTFIAESGGKNPKNISFLIQIFNNLNGSLIAKEEYVFNDSPENKKYGHNLRYESLGNSFPPGRYLISVNITSSDKLASHPVTSLKEYFEVIE